MARHCKSRLKYGGDDNYHIFINSVDGIARIIRLAGLPPEHCRIVCSQSDSSRKQRNQEKLTKEYVIGSTLDPVKTFNFYTSTCFEGQDIFDINGRTFIVSEKYMEQTKMDITTSLLQICGRIRDSKYKTEINQYYATSKYKDVSIDEFMECLYRELMAEKNDAEALNATCGCLSKDANDFIMTYASRKPYLMVVDGKLVADPNAVNVEMVNYGVVNGQYATQCNMNDALAAAGLVVNNTMPEQTEMKLESSAKPITRQAFKEIFEEYCSLREGSIVYDLTFRANQIEVEKPLVKEAYEVLGPDKVRELNYHQGNIKRELVKAAHHSLDTKILFLLDKRLPKGVAIPKSDIKRHLNSIYRELGVNRVAKATEIKDWYHVQEKRKRGDDGKMIACFAIVKAKFKVEKVV